MLGKLCRLENTEHGKMNKTVLSIRCHKKWPVFITFLQLNIILSWKNWRTSWGWGGQHTESAWNKKHETCNLKLETWNLKLETWNLVQSPKYKLCTVYIANCTRIACWFTTNQFGARATHRNCTLYVQYKLYRTDSWAIALETSFFTGTDGSFRPGFHRP